MKRDKIIYWISTALVAAGMLMSAFMYLSASPDLVAGFKQLGYPDQFRIMLGLAKGLGAVALLAPVGERLKEWAYAGFLFTFIAATWTHISTSTPWIAPVIFLALLSVSYVFWVRTREAKKAEA